MLGAMAREAAARLPGPGALGSVQGSAWASMRAALVPPGQPLAGILRLAALLQVWNASYCTDGSASRAEWDIDSMCCVCMPDFHGPAEVSNPLSACM